MKKLIVVLLAASIAISGYGQQQSHYTQFTGNILNLNPAYAGSTAAPCISCLYRTQWVGLEGAPVSQVLNFHMPFLRNRIGVGLSLHHDRIGPTDVWQASLSYAYRLKLGKGYLAFGLQGSTKSYRVIWSEVDPLHEGDQWIPTDEGNKIMLNFGAGLYYHTPTYYVGLSVPHILSNDLATLPDNTNIQNTDLGRELAHYYLTGGVVVPMGKNLKLKPAVLMKYVPNAPFDMDVHASFYFFDRLGLGATYRMGGDMEWNWGESIDFVLQYQASRAIRLGLAYDFTLSKLKSYQTGTFEAMLEYCLGGKSNRLTNPRFF